MTARAGSGDRTDFEADIDMSTQIDSGGTGTDVDIDVEVDMETMSTSDRRAPGDETLEAVAETRHPAYPFPFVVGVGRSGTTLLRTILDAHRDLAVVHESRFVGWMAQNRGRYGSNGTFSSERFLADLLDERSAIPSRLDAWFIEPEQIRAAVGRAAPRDLGEAIRALYGSYAAHHGKARYADKTPGYIGSIQALSEVFPEARFIHLVRDGRDVALSMLDVDFGGVNVPHAAWLWSGRVRAAQRAGHALGPARYLVVRYEDLVGEPAQVVRAICSFLELEFDTAMLHYFEAPDRISAGLGGQHHHEHIKLPPTTGLRDWRTQMQPSDVRRFENIAGDVLVELGYGLHLPPASTGPLNRVTTPVLVAWGRAVAAWRAKQRVRKRR